MVADGYMLGRDHYVNPSHVVRVGNVYKSKSNGPHGRIYGTLYWLVIGISAPDRHRNGVAHLLGLDKDWNIVSACSYGIWAVERYRLLYRFKNVERWTLTLKGEAS